MIYIFFYVYKCDLHITYIVRYDRYIIAVMLVAKLRNPILAYT